MSKRQARALLEKICPHEFKARRVRNIVRRTMIKSKTKEFAAQLDALLAAVDHVHDADERLTAMNPKLVQGQRDGSIAQEKNKAIECLLSRWDELVKLV